MKTKKNLIALFTALIFMLCSFSGWASGTMVHVDIGFLVVAPDRGFMGNEEVRDVFREFSATYNAELAFATEENTEKHLYQGIANLKSRNVRGVWVIPLFLSTSNVRYRQLESALKNYQGAVPVRITEAMNESYLVDEILSARAKGLSKEPSREVLAVVGFGAVDEEGEEGIKKDLKKIVDRVNLKLRFKETEVSVLYSWDADDEIRKEALSRTMDRIAVSTSKGERVVVVPFNFDMRLSNMMSVWGWLKYKIAKYEGTVSDGKGVVPHPNVLRWLERMANQRLPLAREDVGVVMMPHGSGFDWNESMRRAIRPLEEKYKIEYAFSMGDPKIVEKAVRKLEERGSRAIMVVRVFSMESSFREKTEFMLGLISRTRRPTMRVSSGALLTTLGGVEDHPLLAKTMMLRANELSQDPAKETIILLAHGVDNEDRNNKWMNNLRSLANQMRSEGGDRFRSIKFHTWREDWPDKREEAVTVIRGMVEEASRDGGIAIVVPERTAGQGHGKKYLKGLDYRYATGFAPHRNFTHWAEEKIVEGTRIFQQMVGEQDPLFTNYAEDKEKLALFQKRP